MPLHSSAQVVTYVCPKHELLTHIHPAHGLRTSIVSVLTADSSGTKSMRLSRSSSCVDTEVNCDNLSMQHSRSVDARRYSNELSMPHLYADLSMQYSMQQLDKAARCHVDSERQHGLCSSCLYSVCIQEQQFEMHILAALLHTCSFNEIPRTGPL